MTLAHLQEITSRRVRPSQYQPLMLQMVIILQFGLRKYF